jgi:hypothetical protein
MKKIDDVIANVRNNREEASLEYQNDPQKALKEVRALSKKFGIKKSSLKPIKIDFSKLGKKKKAA